MKKIIFLLFIAVSTTLNFSQQFDQHCLYIQELEKHYQNGYLEYNKDYPSSSDNFSYVGKKATNTSTKNTFRSIYSWDHNIPVNSQITSGTLSIKFTITSEQAYPNDYIKLIIKKFPNSHYDKFANEQWSKINNEAVLHTTEPILKGDEYGTYTIQLDQDFINYFQQNLSSGVFHLAFKSHAEEPFGTNKNIHHLDLKINPSVNVQEAVRLVLNYEPSEMTLTAINDMDGYNGGNIGVGKNLSASSKQSPYSVPNVSNGDDINMLAYENQSHNGYNFIWNDTEAPSYKSEWKKEIDHNSVFISSAQSATYQVQSDDNNANLIGYLRKRCNITFANSFNGISSTGTIKVNGSTVSAPTSQYQIVEQNTIQVEALTHTYNDVKYEFSHWSDGGSTTNPRTLTVSEHANITAEFVGTPIFTNDGSNNRDLHFNTYNHRIQNYIKLYWDEHISTNVTKYSIWRGVDTSPNEQIAVVNRGTTSYTDYDFHIEPWHSNNSLIHYDVRAYYLPDQTYSLHDYEAVYGSDGQMSKSADSDSLALRLLEIKEYALSSNYPNPFNPTTQVRYQLPENSFVNLVVYNALGQAVKELVNRHQSNGEYSVQFDASNLPSGIYYYTIKAGDFAKTKKMILMK